MKICNFSRETIMGRSWIIKLVFSTLALSVVLVACNTQTGINIKDPWVRSVTLNNINMPGQSEEMDQGHGGMKSGTSNSAAYMVIQNRGRESDRLLSVECDAARVVELHETKMQDDVMQMRMVPDIQIPAGEEIALTPGGFHIMLIDLQRNLEAGQKINLVLVFENHGRINVEAEILSP
jgi:periplasmic copper chaperone A